MATDYPYTHTWAEDGIQRQTQIHQAYDDEEVVWDPPYPGAEQPWANVDNPELRYDDDEIRSLRR
jgi:hypothetical protein